MVQVTLQGTVEGSIEVTIFRDSNGDGTPDESGQTTFSAAGTKTINSVAYAQGDDYWFHARPVSSAVTDLTETTSIQITAGSKITISETVKTGKP